jgi:hypothetical protein
MRGSTSEVAPISDAVHLCIDMQNVFAPGGLWATPWMERVLPAIVATVALSGGHPAVRLVNAASPLWSGDCRVSG